MATAGKLKDTHLTCSVCFEVFQQPVTLACQHSFCKNCLEKYLQTKDEAVTHTSIPCPTCRQETPVPHPDRPVEDWAGQLKPGLLLTGLMDSLQETVTCSSCKEEGETTPATHWCPECEAGFCDACLKLHRKMPLSRKHVVSNLTEASSVQKIKRKFICREHDKTIKLYCNDCTKPLCTVCCSISHRKCEDVVTIQAMLPKVKVQLQEHRRKLQIQIEECITEMKCCEEQIEKGTDNKLMVKSEIDKKIEIIMEHLQKKKHQLMKKLEDQSEDQTGQLRSRVNTKQIDLQTYQQKSKFIQQAMELEDEAQMFEMYLSSGSGTVSDGTETHREDRRDVDNISFKEDLEQLKAEIDKMDVKVEKIDVDLTAEPVLESDVVTQIEQGVNSDLYDVAMLNVENIIVTVVTDFGGKIIKSFYKLNGKTQCGTLRLDNCPRSIAILDKNKVMLTVPRSKMIVTVNVNPDLELYSTTRTDKEYYAIDVLNQSKFVASCRKPPSIDILDKNGHVMRSLQTLLEPHKAFKNPDFINVTRKGTILVSDWGLNSVICLTQTGHIEWIYKPSGDRKLGKPRGITSTKGTGDILLVDYSSHKVVHLSSRGEFIRDILTAKNGIEWPYGLCVDGVNLCVANEKKGVNVYRFR